MKEKETRPGCSTPSGRIFEVIVTETLKRKIRVYEFELKEATPDDAAQTVSDWWNNSQIILGPEDFVDVEFEASEITETAGTPKEGGDGNA